MSAAMLPPRSPAAPAKRMAAGAPAAASPSPAQRPRAKTHRCAEDGCGAAFHSAARLREHERSHTGERPFVCPQPGCESAFARSHHLSAHARVHASGSLLAEPHASGVASPERVHLCSAAPVCAARFMTASHARRHEETCDVLRAARVVEGGETATEVEDESRTDVERGGDLEKAKKKRGGHKDRDRDYECTEPGCDHAFRKRKHLRAHIWARHSASPAASPFATGTPAKAPDESAKPFVCAQPDCGQAFASYSARRKHMRKHDARRYMCAQHETPEHFETWSALQAHMRAAHPPTCSHPGCGRVFGRLDHLKAHEARHLARHQNEKLAEQEQGTGFDVADEENIEEPPARPLFACTWTESQCTKTFKSAYARDTHIRVFHRGERNHKCACGKAYGHAHLLRAHAKRCSAATGPGDLVDQPAASDVDEGEDGDDDGADSAATSDVGDDEFFRREGGAVPESHASRPRAPRRLSGSAADASAEKRPPKLLHLLTGSSYAQPATLSRRHRTRILSCPWARVVALLDAADDAQGAEAIAALSPQDVQQACAFRFGRLYDARRHMRAVHEVELSDAELRALIPADETAGLPKPRRSETPAK